MIAPVAAQKLPRSNAALELTPQVLAHGSVGNFRARFALRPFHDDIAANQRHDRPTGHVPAFIYGPGRYRVEKIFRDLGPPFQIDDDQVCVSSRNDRPFLWIETENPRGVLA